MAHETGETMAETPHVVPRLWRWVAAGLVWARWVVVLGWVAAVVAATALLPDIRTSQGGLGGLLPAESPAIQAEARTYELFDLPVLARLAVVQRDPAGLPPEVQVNTVRTAAELGEQRLEQGFDNVPANEPLAALPIVNTGGLFPSASEDGTTAVSYLFANPFASLDQQTAAARAYGERLGGPAAGLVGVGGLLPAQVEQAGLILDRLPVLELATVGLVLLILGLAFRSLVAPLVPVLVTVVAYLIALRVLGALGTVADIVLPQELEPLILALLLGVVTDYALFYLFGLSYQLRSGQTRLDAARAATGSYSRIILAAGLTVAASTAALLFARLELYRSFGPGLAVAVLVGMVVAVTLVPALLAITGRWVFWPSALGRGATPAQRPGAAPTPSGQVSPRRPGRLITNLVRRPVALGVAVACFAGLLLAAAPVTQLRLDLSFTAGLPASNPVQQAAQAAGQGFAPGILAPTVLLVEGEGITGQREALSRLQQQLDDQPGIAGVIGPAQQPLPEELGVVLSRTGDAARYLLILDADPLGARAVDVVQRLQQQTPQLLATAGLTGATGSFAGNTPVAVELVERTSADLRRVGLAAGIIAVLVLVVFLRALVAPLYLLVSNILSVAAALGLTTLLFQVVLGRDGITFYVPFATAVLLIALGSDYNVFAVGEVWQEGRVQPLRPALIEATTQTTRIITTAGIALAGSLAMLAVIPLWPFQEIAFTMAAGLLIDVFVVRTLLVPSLITVVGPVSAWPGRRFPDSQGWRKSAPSQL